MEDAAALVASGIVNNDTIEIEVNYGKCIICQGNNFPKKKYPNSKATETGILRAVHCAETRESCKFGNLSPPPSEICPPFKHVM